MLKELTIYLIKFYQMAISPFLGPHCRFEPSCSEYCIQAMKRHGTIKGSYLFLKRLLRCQPFCPGGYDPVP